MSDHNHDSKRRRIALACKACRTRKSRCDGQRPKCSACQAMNFDCVYVQSTSSSNVIVGKEYFAALENRLARVEQRLDGIEPSTSSGVQRSPMRPQTEHSDEVYSPPSERRDGFITINDEGEQEDSTDGMGAIVFTDEEDCGFFGPSSNIAFTRHISRAITRIYKVDGVNMTPGSEGLHLEGGLMSVSRPISPARPNSDAEHDHLAKQKIDLHILPSEEETLELMGHYFSNTGLLFPYIHKDSFLQTYQSMKSTKFMKIRKTWLGLLNMVLAMATSTKASSDLGTAIRIQSSDIYYQRALGLCDKQMLRGTSVELVQYLLLMGKYLQGTQKSVQAWTVHGLAVKAAYQLGLHSSEAAKRFPLLEREIRKRIWYGCVVLDRTLSMTFGRPASIPDDYVKLALPAMVPSSDADSRIQISVEFFCATITLYKVMWNVISQLYGGNISCDNTTGILETVTRLFQMEHQLGEWERSLPKHLSLINVDGMSNILATTTGENVDFLNQCKVIITLRYHNLRILINRIVVVKFLDVCGAVDRGDQEMMLLQQVGSNSMHICIQSSLEIISIVSLNVNSKARRSLLGAWWFSLYYTFNAALILFACILVSTAGSDFPLPPSLDASGKSLQVALDALLLLDNGNRMIKKCTAFLARLIQLLASLTSNTSYLANRPVEYDSPALGSVDFFDSFSLLDQIDTSPLGMELGEFMSEGDLEFFNFSLIPKSLPNGHGQADRGEAPPWMSSNT